MTQDLEAADARADAKLFFEARRDEFEARVALLPEWFQLRYKRLYSDIAAHWDDAGFEIFIYDEALKIANVLKSPKAVKDFWELSFSEQSKIIKDLSLCARHSCATFEATLRIAYQYLKETSTSDSVISTDGSPIF